MLINNRIYNIDTNSRHWAISLALIVSLSVIIKRAYGLHVVADTLAAAAEDTFVHVADDGRSHLPLAG